MTPVRGTAERIVERMNIRVSDALGNDLGPSVADMEPLIQAITTALVSAEAAGMERAAKALEDRAYDLSAPSMWLGADTLKECVRVIRAQTRDKGGEG